MSHPHAPQAQRTYGTAAEKAFLTQLATSPAARMLLTNYVKAAGTRSKWETINREQVLAHAHQLLERQAR